MKNLPNEMDIDIKIGQFIMLITAAMALLFVLYFTEKIEESNEKLCEHCNCKKEKQNE